MELHDRQAYSRGIKPEGSTMKSPTLAKLNTMVLAFVLLTFSSVGHSEGGNYSSDFDFEPVMELIAEERSAPRQSK